MPPDASASYEMASVLFVDVVGYSLQSLENQTRLLTTLQQIVRGTAQFQLATQSGDLISLPTGDGMALVFFRNPVSPVQCAVEISAALRHQPDLPLRMGIHTGPVHRHADIKNDANVIGGGINLAQRVMDCGDAGHILVSRTVGEVLEQLSEWRDALHDLGTCEVKHGITIQVYNLYRETLGNPKIPSKILLHHQTRRARARPWWKKWPAAAALLILAAPAVLIWWAPRHSIRSIAVLPLDNYSGDPSQDYFAAGITDELTAQIAAIQQLRVISRSSVMQYKGRDRPPAREIAKALDVDALIEGSVQRSGDNVRITAELIDAREDKHLWAKTFERNSRDVLAIQNELVSALAREIHVQTRDAQPLQKRAVNPDAYDFYLRGLYHTGRYNEADINHAIDLFEKAVAIDPSFAPAQALLARVHAEKSYLLHPDDPQWEEKGFANVQKALALNPDSPEAHFARGMLLWGPSHGFPAREALEEFRKAIASNPNYDEAWHEHGTVLLHVGHLKQAALDIEHALSINPANTLARFRYAPILEYQIKYAEALESLNTVPKQVFLANWEYHRAWCLLSLGRDAEAKTELETALSESPRDPGGLLHGARAMLRAKSHDRGGAEADIADAIRAGKGFWHFHHTAYMIGAVYSIMGDIDKAQEWIEKSANDGFPCYTLFEKDPYLANARTSPKFRALLTRLRQEWEHIPGEND